MTRGPLESAVTALFVPGDRPERFGKACEAGPGLVIIDLEDAVASDSRPAAREAAAAFLSSPAASARVPVLVRINAAGTPDFALDVAALAALPAGALPGVVLAKAEDPRVVDTVRAALGDVPIIPIVESARGLASAEALAAAAGVVRLAFGALDFSLDLDCAPDDAVLLPARSRIVLASRLADRAAPLDSPSTAIADEAVVRDAAARARALGFGGQLCIHPSQVRVVEAAFAPTEAEIEWARRVVGAEGGAARVDGRMVDRPVTERARRLLERAAENGRRA